MLGLPGGLARNLTFGVGWGFLLGWGCNYVSGSFTHGGCYATAWVGWGAATLVFMCTHATLLVCHVQRCYAWGALWCIVWTFVLFKHGTLLVCSCVHMVRCWCVMCKRITQSQCHVWLSIVSSSWWVECISSCHVSQKQVKLHQTAFMANRVKWIRFKLQVIVDFSARFGEKNSRLDIVKTFIWKHDMQSTSEKTHFLWKTQ